MPDLPTRLARKWCQACVNEKLNLWPTGGHSHEVISAAVREALEEVVSTTATSVAAALAAEDEFAHAVRVLCQQFGGSVTSWGRTDAHSKAVGGFVGDPHTHWYGADIVWDAPEVGTARHAVAFELGLTLIHEGTHDHVQPGGYPVGPLTPEQVQSWKDERS